MHQSCPRWRETEVNLFLAAGNPYLPTFCIIEHQEGEEGEEEDDDDDGDSGAQARESTEILPVEEQKRGRRDVTQIYRSFPEVFTSKIIFILEMPSPVRCGCQKRANESCC